MKPITLSRKDEMGFVEINNDRYAAKITLEVALDNHHNTTVALRDRSKKLWDHVFETYGLDAEVRYKTTQGATAGRMQIVEVEKD